MSDDERDPNSFEDTVRALFDEVTRAVERLSEIDVDEIARTASAEAERARRWVDELAQGLRTAAAPADGPPRHEPAAEDPLWSAGPHPLDLPTADQGRALAALDSGRWGIEPGTSTLAVRGEGPGPSDALGLVRELRVRDWLSAGGELTLAGRTALKRWLEAAARS